MDIDTFLSANKSMVIAPAGFGKTYTIAECIASYRGEKRVLVLTHTHAGIASLKEKFRLKNIPSSTYQLETICGFALNLVKAYHLNKDEILISFCHRACDKNTESTTHKKVFGYKI